MKVCEAISSTFLGSIIVLYGRINSKDYLNILRDYVHLMAQSLFRDGDGIFQDKNTLIYTAHMVKNWYEEFENYLENMAWPPQSLNLNMWCVLEQQVKNRYPPPSYLEELEHVFVENS